MPEYLHPVWNAFIAFLSAYLLIAAYASPFLLMYARCKLFQKAWLPWWRALIPLRGQYDYLKILFDTEKYAMPFMLIGFAGFYLYFKDGMTPFLAVLTVVMYLIIMVRTAIVFNHGTLFGILFIIVCPFFAEVWMAQSKKTVYLGGYTGD